MKFLKELVNLRDSVINFKNALTLCEGIFQRDKEAKLGRIYFLPKISRAQYSGYTLKPAAGVTELKAMDVPGVLLNALQPAGRVEFPPDHSSEKKEYKSSGTP